jgi:DNA recombination protein RmuC
MMFVYGILVGIFLTSIVFIFVYKILSKSFESHVKESAQTGLDQTLLPFKEKIDDYNKSLTDFKEKNIEQNAVLRTELKHMMELSSRMELETKGLTNALKGDVKAQGDWGEFILERSLEISGMEKGREFTLQGEGMGLQDIDGNSFRPDAIINLPNKSHIVVDSKVSLKSLNEKNVKELKKSLTAHIDGLSKKGYQKLEGLSTPDFVMMFIPLESIMPIIFKEFPEILDYAAKKNIVLATPISLLPILKTIMSLWRIDKQGENAEEIARKAGLLYDKFSGLYEDLQKTKDIIKRLSESHDASLNKLGDGRGNLLGKVEELRTLGAKTSREIDT